MGKGIPWWYPLVIHIISPWEKEMLEKGGARFIDVRRFIGE